jgi:hypothetical protein
VFFFFISLSSQSRTCINFLFVSFLVGMALETTWPRNDLLELLERKVSYGSVFFLLFGFFFFFKRSKSTFILYFLVGDTFWTSKWTPGWPGKER